MQVRKARARKRVLQPKARGLTTPHARMRRDRAHPRSRQTPYKGAGGAAAGLAGVTGVTATATAMPPTVQRRDGLRRRRTTQARPRLLS